MKPSRIIGFVGGYYILILGIVMFILSIFSLVAYKCHFHDAFTHSPAGYMFHLLYYRSHHCDPSVDWSIFGVENITFLPDMPLEISTVTRTFWIAVIQLFFNFLLIITSANMLISSNNYWLVHSRRLSYWLFFAPFSVILLLTIFLDMSTGHYYSLDRFRSLSVDGTMRLLEIANLDEVRPLIDQINVAHRSLAPDVMLYVSLKGVAGVILNIVVLFFVTLTGWEVVDRSKRKAALKFVTEKKAQSTTEPSTVL